MVFMSTDRKIRGAGIFGSLVSPLKGAREAMNRYYTSRFLGAGGAPDHLAAWHSPDVVRA